PGILASRPTACVAYFVMGTSSPAAMIFTPGVARSAGVVMPAGLAVGTITVRLLPAKAVVGPVVRPAVTRASGFLVSADRKTSAGAPFWIWVARAADESVEMVSRMPGTAASYAVFTLARTSLRDAAAKIVNPAGPACEGATGVAPDGATDGAALGPLVVPLVPLQATSTAAMTSNSTGRRVVRTFTI